MGGTVYTISPMGRRLGSFAILFGLGALAAWLVLGGPRPASHPGVATATLGGQLLPAAAPDAVLEAAREAARSWLGQPVSVVVAGEKTSRTREQLGARIDWAHLRALLAELADPRSALRRGHARAPGSARGPVALPLPYTVDFQAAMGELLQIKEGVDRPAVDARYDFKTKSVSADEPGRRMDAWGTLARLDAALEHGDTAFEAIVETAPAHRTAAALAGVRTDHVLGWFETQYMRDAKHEARAFNLQVAASRLDGFVVMPGETFDFNQVVGPRTESNGYKVAPVIALGELVDGMGGGTCQVAGTLHAAALFAGLDIVERRPHTRPSYYIKMGLDAAVAYPAVTLRLGNPFSFPVVLHESVQGGTVRGEILGPPRTREVVFERRIDEVLRFQEKEVPDTGLPKGARELKQRGVPGFKITRWRVLMDGPFAVREHRTDYYPPTAQIWKVGKGPDDAKFEAHDDDHPEFIADEFLTLSEGLDAKGELVEARVPGKTGTYGWTVREGFAKGMEGTRSKRPAKAAREGID
jgi:vancomycin resistance protein YoaR